MPLPTSIKRALPLGKSRDARSHNPESKSSARPPQSSASALQRAIHKSTFLYGPAPPTTGSGLTPEHIRDFLVVLSQPTNTPMLTTRIAKLSSPLSRHHKSLAADCLCDVHTWFDLRWINEMTDIVGGEVGPHLNHLRSAPNWLTSIETKEILGMLEPYAHIFPAPDPDGSRIANPYQCNDSRCGTCKGITCKACRLSMFLQNTEAVKALNICAKGRKRGGKPWPVACSWLDPIPIRSGWAAKWKKEGLPVLSDRIIARRWRKSGRQQRMTEEMRNLQSEVIADRDSADRVLGNATRQSVQSAFVDSDSVLDDITGRPWSVHDEGMRSSDTVDLLKKLGLEDDDGEERMSETGSASSAKSYESLRGHQQQSSIHGSIRHADEDDDDIEQEQRRRSRQPYATSTKKPSRASSKRSFQEQPHGKAESPITSTQGYSDGRGRHSPKVVSNGSRDSVSSASTWNSASSRSSRGSQGTSLGNAASSRHSGPYLGEDQKGGRGESRDSWSHFNKSPLARNESSISQAQSCPSRSKLSVVEQSGHGARYSTVPDIPIRSPARLSARAKGVSSNSRERESRRSKE